ncbi:RebB family R body protein [Tistlia consotensis]|uniref:RebB family R body protein n=1 Tax=Tistlia consotensis TaxID=1321365 RepID=UPI00190EAC88|nr:RebB family R body protein [Tistlia consotensis]
MSVKSGANEQTITTSRSAPRAAAARTSAGQTGGETAGGGGSGGSGGSAGDGGGGGDGAEAPPSGLGLAAEAVAAANVLAVGESPAMALSMIYQAMAGATAAGMQNAILQQATANTILQTATLKGIEQLLGAGLDTTTTATTLLAGEVSDSTVSALAKAIVDRLASQPTS